MGHAGKKLYEAQEKDYLKLEREFSRLAQQNEADPKNVIVDMRSDQNPASPVQAPGAQDQSRQAPDGNWYVPDPNRPGKYLRVDK